MLMMEQNFTITTEQKLFDNLVNWLHKFKQIVLKIPLDIMGLKRFFSFPTFWYVNKSGFKFNYNM
jgi:hypothetical protein